MMQLLHTGIIVVGCVTAILALLVALPNSRLREFIYFLANHRNRDQGQLR